jgi:hypothetical protein
MKFYNTLINGGTAQSRAEETATNASASRPALAR